MLGLCKVTSFDRYLCWLEHFGKDTYRAALQRKVADDIVQRISASLRRGGYKPQDLFSKLDADGSGQLSRQELLSIVLRLEPGLSPAEQEAIFQRFDADGSGSVSWAEFWETIQGGGAAQPLAQTLPARVGVAGALPLRPLDPGSGLAATAPAQQPVAVQAGGFDQTIHPQDPGAAVELQRQRAMAEEILARIAANIVRAGRRPQEFLRDARGTLARGEVEQTLFRFEPNLSAYEREAIISRLGADGHLAAQRVRRYGNVNAAEFCRILGGDLAQIGKSLVQPAEVPVGMAPQELLKQVATELRRSGVEAATLFRSLDVSGMNTAYNNFVAYGDWDSAEFACFAGLPCISPFVPLHSLERRLALLFLLRTHLVEIDAWRRWLQPDGFGLDAQPSVSLFFHLADGLEAAGPEAIAALQALPRARVIPTVATGWCELMAAEVALFQAALQHEPSAEMLVLLPHDVGSLLQACSMDKSSSSTFRGDASSSALRGGVAAVLVQTACVPTFMWMHTVTNYQYRYGGTAIDVVRALYAEGGPRRFYRGIVPALLQSAILRFGGLAVNEGLLAATARSSMDGPCASHGLSSTMAAATSSLATSVLRVVLMPLDAWQTAKQVNGEHGFKRVLKEARSRPSATIGFAANVAGDASSNFLRVLKTLQQTAGREMTYMSAAKELLRQDGVRGLFGRGLPTKVILVLERKALLDGNAGVSRICPAGVRDVEVPHDCAHGIEPHWARSLMLKHHQWIALSRNHAAHLVHPQALAAANGIFESEYLGEPLCSDEVLPLLTLALKEQVVQDKAPAEQVLAQGPMECKVVHSWDELLHILSAGSHERCENLQVAARGDMPIRMSLSLSSAFAMNQSLLELTLTVDARAALGLQGLGQNTTLRHLSLHVLHWGACGELGRAVAAVLKQNSSLQSLCLKADATNLSDKTGVVLAQALTQNSSLSRFLVASVNSLPLAPAGHSFILVSFDELEGSRCARGMSFSTQETSVGDETGTALAEALQQNCNLQSFHFSANGTEVSDDSGIALASILSVNSALQKFSFKACKTEISDSTGTAIASSLCSNSSLRSFSFLANSCNISDETCQAMADSIGNTCLTSVEFVALHVFVSEKTITCLQNALHRNRGLQSVRFETSQDGACVTVREGKAMQDQVRCEHKQNGSAYPTYPCFQVPLFAQSFGKDFLETSLSHSSDWGSAIVIESEHGEDMVLRSGKLSCADSLSETDVGDAEAVTTASTDAHEAPIWESFGV
eukprot:s755_g22.t1